MYHDIQKIRREYHIYITFVIFLISLQLICNLIEPITVNLGYFKLPASALFYVFSFAASDIITENFGFKMAVSATYYNVIAQLIFCGIAAVVNYGLPAQFDSHQGEATFHYFFHFLSFELIGSLVSLVVAKVANDYLMDKLRRVFLAGSFWWRTIVATITGELVMLNIDYNITFFGHKGWMDIQKIIFSAMIYKGIAALVLSLPATIITYKLSKKIVFLKPKIYDTNKSYWQQLGQVFIFK